MDAVLPFRLVPFEPRWAAEVAGWATTPDEVLAWCSGLEVPVPAAQVTSWSDADDVEAYVLFHGDELVGNGEVWVDDDEAETELAHLIVAPHWRGMGVGRVLTRLLAVRAAARHPAVFLRVRPGNEPALRCYAAAGFERLNPDDEQVFNVGQPVAYVWMRQPPGR